jgi:hypothetical protein
MFAPNANDLVTFDPSERPHLIVIVDAEEEFGWKTFSSTANSVRNIAAQTPAQNILDEFCIRPTYLVDYPVAAQPQGYEPLKTLLDAGRCDIGAQLHPWVNPPIDEEITLRNTFPGNLPAPLEYAKIAQLTATITANFGIKPVVFKAGRYGVGPNTAAALIANGYNIDASVMPLADFSREGGPDYTNAPAVPYWIDAEQRLLEIPTTVGLVGLMGRSARNKVHALLSTASAALRVPGLLSRLGILERIRLTPEGISLDEAKRLTMSMFRQGQRLFVLSYHSSSMWPGGTPYVSTQTDIDRMLVWLNGYCRFFFGALGGRATRPETVLAHARQLRAEGVARMPQETAFESMLVPVTHHVH